MDSFYISVVSLPTFSDEQLEFLKCKIEELQRKSKREIFSSAFEEKIQNFQGIAGGSRHQAITCLKESGEDLESAIAMFFENPPPANAPVVVEKPRACLNLCHIGYPLQDRILSFLSYRELQAVASTCRHWNTLLKTPEFVSRKFGQRGRSFEAAGQVTNLVVSEEAKVRSLLIFLFFSNGRVKGLFVCLSSDDGKGVCCASTVRMKPNQTLSLPKMRNNFKIVPAIVNIMSETFVLTIFDGSPDAVLCSINNQETKFMIGNSSNANVIAVELWWEKGKVTAALADESGRIRIVDISNLIKTKTVIEMGTMEVKGNIVGLVWSKKCHELFVVKDSSVEVWKESKMLTTIEFEGKVRSFSSSHDWLVLSKEDESIVAINVLSKVQTKSLVLSHSNLVCLGSLIYVLHQGDVCMVEISSLSLVQKKLIFKGAFKQIASNEKVLYVSDGKDVVELI